MVSGNASSKETFEIMSPFVFYIPSCVNNETLFLISVLPYIFVPQVLYRWMQNRNYR